MAFACFSVLTFAFALPRRREGKTMRQRLQNGALTCALAALPCLLNGYGLHRNERIRRGRQACLIASRAGRADGRMRVWDGGLVQQSLGG